MKSCLAPPILHVDGGSDAGILQQTCHYLDCSTFRLHRERKSTMNVCLRGVRTTVQQGNENVKGGRSMESALYVRTFLVQQPHDQCMCTF